MSAADTLLAVTTIAFDIAALEVFLPLITGARLLVAREDEVRSGAALKRLIEAEGVTILQATPVTWQMLIEAGWSGLPGMKMLCGGEALQRRLAETLLLGGGELWNMYGPTETTIWSSVLRVLSGTGRVPIGPPIANTQFYVLDGQRQLLPSGVPGELYIGGDGLASGYCRQPEETQARFTRNPFGGVAGAKLYRTGDIVRSRSDGCFEYLGRSDNQIKLRGYRIELGEIESVLERNPKLFEAAARIGLDPAGEPAIWAYAVESPAGPERGPRLLDELRADLKRCLPAYMQPASIMLLGALPRTPNGKIDRKALPPPEVVDADAGESPSGIPLTDVEARLGAIWCSILGLKSAPIDVDFIDLGGHSLLAARLMGRVEAEFGQRISLGILFRAPTIAAQAKLLSRTDIREYDFRKMIRLRPNGSLPPLIAINNTGLYYYNLSRHLGAEQPLTALQLFGPEAQEQTLPADVEGIAAGYVALIREFQPTGPYNLMGWCAGGVLAFEVAKQLTAAGEQIATLTMFDTWAPGYMKRLSLLRALLADHSYRWQLIMADWSRTSSQRGHLWHFLARRILFKRVIAWFRMWAGSAVGGVAPKSVMESDEKHDQWLLNYLDQAAERYEPGLYAGRITLIRSSRQPMGLFLDSEMGWGSLCTEGVEIKIVDGDHFTMFREPGVNQMAHHLSEALATASKLQVSTAAL